MAGEWEWEVQAGAVGSGIATKTRGVKRLASEPQPGYSQTRQEGASLPGVRGTQTYPLGDLPQSEVSVLLWTEGSAAQSGNHRSEEHTSELQSRLHLVCRLLLEKKNSQARASQKAVSLLLCRCLASHQ